MEVCHTKTGFLKSGSRIKSALPVLAAVLVLAVGLDWVAEGRTSQGWLTI